MRARRWWAPTCAAVAMGVLMAGCKRNPAQDAPSPVVVTFYTARIASPTTGAPTGSELQQFAPLLSDTLTALLRAAAIVRDRAAKQAPDEKPPFAEGDLYSSLFEGPTRFTLVRDTIAAGQHKVVVQFTHLSNGDRYAWTDTVQLVKKGRADVIDDVLYGGAGEFGNKGTLRHSLESALREYAAPATPVAPTRPASAPSTSR